MNAKKSLIKLFCVNTSAVLKQLLIWIFKRWSFIWILNLIGYNRHQQRQGIIQCSVKVFLYPVEIINNCVVLLAFGTGLIRYVAADYDDQSEKTSSSSGTIKKKTKETPTHNSKILPFFVVFVLHARMKVHSIFFEYFCDNKICDVGASFITLKDQWVLSYFSHKIMN